MPIEGSWPRRWAPALPVVLLVLVAGAQMTLAHTSALSPWKGGGFGMFSTLDARPFRYVRVYVTAPERSEELAVPGSLEDAAAAVAVLPTAAQLERFARAVAARERSHGRPVDLVRVEVWREEFAAGSLAPSTRILRQWAHRVAD